MPGEQKQEHVPVWSIGWMIGRNNEKFISRVRSVIHIHDVKPKIKLSFIIIMPNMEFYSSSTWYKKQIINLSKSVLFAHLSAYYNLHCLPLLRRTYFNRLCGIETPGKASKEWYAEETTWLWVTTASRTFILNI